MTTQHTKVASRKEMLPHISFSKTGARFKIVTLKNSTLAAMTRVALAAAVVASTMLSLDAASVAQTGTTSRQLVFQNTCPPPPQNDPKYLAGIAALQKAVSSGSRLYAVMQDVESGVTNWFFVEITAAKVTPNYASALLALRPIINNSAQAIESNGLVAGSIDTLGNYVYGAYFFNSAPSSGQTATYACYVNSWYAD